jgi:glutathione S-transferase
MSLALHYHPLASYCWKVLIALYENDTAFERNIVDLANEESRNVFLKLWPAGKFPVLEDRNRNEIIPESSIIIEYLDRHYPGAVRFIPENSDQALNVRLADRFYDLYVHERMQKIVGDRIRPAGDRDPYGVEQARSQLATAYGLLEERMAGRGWAAGEAFSMADCAAFPALFYAEKVQPFRAGHKNLSAYFDRLSARPSAARVVAEAGPYMHFFPEEDR